MRKEFPPDRWIRKNVSPLALTVGVAIFLVCFCFFSKVLLPLVMAASAIGLLMIVYHIVWDIKHPYEVEFCKECNQALPEKYED